MAITPDGWFDWMRREPGPHDKVYSETNRIDFYVAHSAVGYCGGWTGRLFSRERDAAGRYSNYAAVSAHGWIPYDGACVQHYPITASCWTSGSRVANTRGVAFETEGGVSGRESEPLTEGQTSALARILADIAAWKGVSNAYWRRPACLQDLDATLYEHRECVRFGAAPTACPSGRIPWPELLRRLQPGTGAAPLEHGWRTEPPLSGAVQRLGAGVAHWRRAAGTHLEAVRRPLSLAATGRQWGSVLVG